MGASHQQRIDILMRDRVSLFSLLKHAAKAYTGLHWFPASLAFLLFVLWPILVFWPKVSFDASGFVEEWVKLTSGGLVLLFIFELGKLRAESHKAADLSIKSFSFHYLPVIEQLRRDMESLLKARQMKDLEKMQYSALSGSRSIIQLRANIDLASTLSLGPELTAFLYAERDGQALNHARSIFDQCRASARPENITIEEVHKALAEISDLINQLKRFANQENQYGDQG
jgi:hypothetical protein